MQFFFLALFHFIFEWLEETLWSSCWWHMHIMTMINSDHFGCHQVASGGFLIIFHILLDHLLPYCLSLFDFYFHAKDKPYHTHFESLLGIKLHSIKWGEQQPHKNKDERKGNKKITIKERMFEWTEEY